MADLQDEMAIAQQEVEQANGALQKAVRERRAAKIPVLREGTVPIDFGLMRGSV